MPFAIPSLRELVERARLSFRAHLPGSDAWIWPNNIGPSAKVMAGMTSEVFGYADYIARQRLPLTAEKENLDDHGKMYGLARRVASPARGMLRFAATTALTVEDGAIVERGDGVQFRIPTGGAILGPGDLLLDAVSVANGAATQSVFGTPMTSIGGVTGSTVITVHTNGLVGGGDVESDDSFRGRILFRIRNVPQGGSAADYVSWATDMPGVTRAYVERNWRGAGTVRVFVLFDDDYPHGIAPQSAIAPVRDYIELLRPAGATVTVAPPAAFPVDVVIRGLSPDMPSVRNAIVEETRAMFRRVSRPAGGDVELPGIDYLATPQTFSRSWLWQSAANASGEMRHDVIAPVVDQVVPPGAIAILNGIQFAA